MHFKVCILFKSRWTKLLLLLLTVKSSFIVLQSGHGFEIIHTYLTCLVTLIWAHCSIVVIIHFSKSVLLLTVGSASNYLLLHPQRALASFVILVCVYFWVVDGWLFALLAAHIFFLDWSIFSALFMTFWQVFNFCTCSFVLTSPMVIYTWMHALMLQSPFSKCSNF